MKLRKHKYLNFSHTNTKKKNSRLKRGRECKMYKFKQKAEYKSRVIARFFVSSKLVLYFKFV